MQNWYQMGDLLTIQSNHHNRLMDQTIIFIKENGSSVIGIPVVPQIIQSIKTNHLLVQPNEENGLKLAAVALLDQKIQVEGRFIQEKIGVLSFEEIEFVQKNID